MDDMGKGVYPRTRVHREIALRGSRAAAAGRRGKSYEQLYGAERARQVRQKLADSKSGGRNPAKRPEVRAKIGLAAKGRPSWLRGLTKESDARVMAISEVRRGKKVGAAAFISESSKLKRREKTKATWAAKPELKARVFNVENNEKRRISHIRALHEGKYANRKDTNIEREIEARLQAEGLIMGKDYFKQVPLPEGAPQFVADFFIPSEKLVIEGYGCFWHKCSACGYGGPRTVDERRRIVLESAGLSLTIVWGHEL